MALVFRWDLGLHPWSVWECRLVFVAHFVSRVRPRLAIKLIVTERDRAVAFS